MISGASSTDAASFVSVVPLVATWRLDRAFTYRVPGTLSGRVEIGTLVRIPLGGRRVRGIVVGLPDTAEVEVRDVAGVVVEPPLAPPPMPELASWIAMRYAARLSDVLARVVPPRVRVKEAPSTGARARVEPKRILEYRGGPELLRAVHEGRAGAWCLRASLGEDTGALIAELAAGARGQVLVTVPEVRRGSATIRELSRALPELVRVDSAVGDQERSRGWIQLAAGAPAGAGGRSAVLAPAPRLKLIVVDAEHHRSYKEERAPRYLVSRVARERARLQDALCVFVDASPSVELGAAAYSGAIGLAEPERVTDRDTRPLIEFHARPQDRSISHQLHVRIRDALREGERVALLVPVAGYARAIWCAACRRSVRCPACEAGMIYARGRVVRCPRCGFRSAAPDRCAHCGSVDFRLLGAGNERLAEQLGRAFPRARVATMDPELAAELPTGDRIDAQIYVTTWVGTKETVRPDASLVAVLDADAMIRRPHFRASETAYQALAEMAAWAGPGRAGGRLFVQTAEPGHHCLQALARNDYRFFLQRELEMREELFYPPYSELIKVTALGPERHELIAQAGRIARAGRARVLGPIEVGSVQRRSELLLKCESAEGVAGELRGILQSVPSGNRLRIDVDPR